MTALVVPADFAAEVAVAGCAVSNRHGAALAAARLSEDSFYWPRNGRLFTAAGAITEVGPEPDRIAACAAQADVPVAQVAALVAARPIMWDATGSYARRVLEAARRRRVMHIAETAYRRIAEGGTVEEALSLLQAAS